METFLKYVSAVVIALFFLAFLGAMYAGLAWVVKAVWTS